MEGGGDKLVHRFAHGIAIANDADLGALAAQAALVGEDIWGSTDRSGSPDIGAAVVKVMSTLDLEMK